jgi:hypothetical protein
MHVVVFRKTADDERVGERDREKCNKVQVIGRAMQTQTDNKFLVNLDSEFPNELEFEDAAAVSLMFQCETS